MRQHTRIKMRLPTGLQGYCQRNTSREVDDLVWSTMGRGSYLSMICLEARLWLERLF